MRNPTSSINFSTRGLELFLLSFWLLQLSAKQPFNRGQHFSSNLQFYLSLYKGVNKFSFFIKHSVSALWKRNGNVCRNRTYIIRFGVWYSSIELTHYIYQKWSRERDSNPWMLSHRRFSRPLLSATQPSLDNTIKILISKTLSNAVETWWAKPVSCFKVFSQLVKLSVLWADQALTISFLF